MTKFILDSFTEDCSNYPVTLANGIRLNVYEAGSRGSLETIVFLHGFPELAHSWRYQFYGLSTEFLCIAPDMRGFGDSDRPKKSKDYKRKKLIEDVQLLIEHYKKGPIHLVGHDWGGAIAWHFAEKHPEYLKSLSILNCPHPNILLRSATNLDQLKKSWYMFFFQIPLLAENLAKKYPEGFVQKALTDTAFNKTPFTEKALRPYIELAKSGIGSGLNYYKAVFKSPPLRRKKINIPVQIIWGVHDTLLKKELASPDKYKSFVKDLKVHFIHNSGHWVQQEAWLEVNQKLFSFIKN